MAIGEHEMEAKVRRLFDGYRTNDRSLVEAVLAEDFSFTSPYDDAIDRAEYFARCWPNAGAIERHTIENMAVNGNRVYATYLCAMKDGRSFRNTESFDFSGGKVVAINVYFGAAYDRDGNFETKS